MRAAKSRRAQVRAMMGEGLTGEQIAARLGCSVQTARRELRDAREDALVLAAALTPAVTS